MTKTTPPTPPVLQKVTSSDRRAIDHRSKLRKDYLSNLKKSLEGAKDEPIPENVLFEQIVNPIVNGIVEDVSRFGKGKFQKGFKDLIPSVSSPSEAEGTASQLKKWGYRSAETTTSVDEDVLQMPSAIETNSSWEIVKRNLYAEAEHTSNEASTYNERSFPIMNAKFKRARLEDESPAQKEHRRNIEAMKKLLPTKEEQPQSEAEQVVDHFLKHYLLENAYLRFRYHEIKKKLALEEENESESSENADQVQEKSNEVANEDEAADNVSYDSNEDEVTNEDEEEEEEKDAADNDSYEYSDQLEEEERSDEDAESELRSEDVDEEEEEDIDANGEADSTNSHEDTPFEMVSGIISSILDMVTNEKHNESEAEVTVGRGENNPFEMVSGIISSMLDMVTNEKRDESEAEVIVRRVLTDIVQNAYFRGKYGDQIRAAKNARAAGNAKKGPELLLNVGNDIESEESDSDYMYVDDDVNELTLGEKMDMYFNSFDAGESLVDDQNHAYTQTDEVGLLITQIPTSLGSVSEVATFLEKYGKLSSIKLRHVEENDSNSAFVVFQDQSSYGLAIENLSKNPLGKHWLKEIVNAKLSKESKFYQDVVETHVLFPILNLIAGIEKEVTTKKKLCFMKDCLYEHNSQGCQSPAELKIRESNETLLSEVFNDIIARLSLKRTENNFLQLAKTMALFDHGVGAGFVSEFTIDALKKTVEKALCSITVEWSFENQIDEEELKFVLDKANVRVDKLMQIPGQWTQILQGIPVEEEYAITEMRYEYLIKIRLFKEALVVAQTSGCCDLMFRDLPSIYTVGTIEYGNAVMEMVEIVLQRDITMNCRVQSAIKDLFRIRAYSSEANTSIFGQYMDVLFRCFFKDQEMFSECLVKYGRLEDGRRMLKFIAKDFKHRQDESLSRKLLKCLIDGMLPRYPSLMYYVLKCALKMVTIMQNGHDFFREILDICQTDEDILHLFDSIGKQVLISKEIIDAVIDKVKDDRFSNSNLLIQNFVKLVLGQLFEKLESTSEETFLEPHIFDLIGKYGDIEDSRKMLDLMKGPLLQNLSEDILASFIQKLKEDMLPRYPSLMHQVLNCALRMVTIMQNGDDFFREILDICQTDQDMLHLFDSIGRQVSISKEIIDAVIDKVKDDQFLNSHLLIQNFVKLVLGQLFEKLESTSEETFLEPHIFDLIGKYGDIEDSRKMLDLMKGPLFQNLPGGILASFIQKLKEDMFPRLPALQEDFLQLYKQQFDKYPTESTCDEILSLCQSGEAFQEVVECISAFTAFGRNWTSSPDVLVSIMYKMVGESKKSWPNSLNQCMDIVVEHFALDPAKWGHLVATNADEENAQKCMESLLAHLDKNENMKDLLGTVKLFISNSMTKWPQTTSTVFKVVQKFLSKASLTVEQFKGVFSLRFIPFWKNSTINTKNCLESHWNHQMKKLPSKEILSFAEGLKDTFFNEPSIRRLIHSLIDLVMKKHFNDKIDKAKQTQVTWTRVYSEIQRLMSCKTIGQICEACLRLKNFLESEKQEEFIVVNAQLRRCAVNTLTKRIANENTTLLRKFNLTQRDLSVADTGSEARRRNVRLSKSGCGSLFVKKLPMSSSDTPSLQIARYNAVIKDLEKLCNDMTVANIHHTIHSSALPIPQYHHVTATASQNSVRQVAPMMPNVQVPIGRFVTSTAVRPTPNLRPTVVPTANIRYVNLMHRPPQPSGNIVFLRAVNPNPAPTRPPTVNLQQNAQFVPVGNDASNPEIIILQEVNPNQPNSLKREASHPLSEAPSPKRPPM